MIVGGVALMFGAFLTQTASAQTASRQTTPAAVSDCAPPPPGAPMFVTGDCVDARYKDPYIDIDEMRNTPVPHRYVHDGFKGTDAFCEWATTWELSISARVPSGHSWSAWI